MAFKVTGELIGLKDVLARLKGKEKKVRKKLLKKALDAGGNLVLKSARAKVATRTKLLRKSLGKKVRVYRGGAAAVVVIGPRTGFKQHVRLPDGSFQLENPTNIAHLVEKGRRAVYVKTKKVLSTGAVIFGRKVASVPARPFMRPAFDENKSAAEQLIRDTIKQGLEEQ